LLVCRLNREHIDQGYYVALRRNRGRSVTSFKDGRHNAYGFTPTPDRSPMFLDAFFVA
jgi:hypothetical protein